VRPHGGERRNPDQSTLTFSRESHAQDQGPAGEANGGRPRVLSDIVPPTGDKAKNDAGNPCDWAALGEEKSRSGYGDHKENTDQVQTYGL